MSSKIFINCGFAGSGKTTFTHALSQSIRENGNSVYICNLDPAVHFLPYQPNLDIRDTVDYHGIMKEHCLGPNGSILTCLNLFVTKIDEIIKILSNKSEDYIIIDTPGQVEILTESISGEILCKSLKSHFFNVKLNYIIDTPACYNKDMSINSPLTISNMLFASSVYLKMNIPLQIIYNKIDISHDQKNVLGNESILENKDLHEDLLNDIFEQFKEISSQLPHYFVSSMTLFNISELLK